jgi:hypothetical protein
LAHADFPLKEVETFTHPMFNAFKMDTEQKAAKVGP